MTLQMNRLLNRAIKLKQQLDELNEEYDFVKRQLKEKMRNSQISDLTTSKAKAQYRIYKSETFDKALFKLRCPKIYARFSDTIDIERLTILQNKEKSND